jgi:hypothetical protein
MKTIEELRNELLKIGEQLGEAQGQTITSLSLTNPMGLQLPILKFMAKNIILSSVKEALRYSEK